MLNGIKEFLRLLAGRPRPEPLIPPEPEWAPPEASRTPDPEPERREAVPIAGGSNGFTPLHNWWRVRHNGVVGPAIITGQDVVDAMSAFDIVRSRLMDPALLPPEHLISFFDDFSGLSKEQIGVLTAVGTWTGFTTPGQSIPPGGNPGQSLGKVSAIDFDVDWQNPPVGPTGPAAYTRLAASFTMPTQGGEGVAVVEDARPFAGLSTMLVHVGNLGYLRVLTSIPDRNQLILVNDVNAQGNAPPGTVANALNEVTPTGPAGPVSALAILQTPFAMPAVNGPAVLIIVDGVVGFQVGMYVFLQGMGYLQIINIGPPSGLQVTNNGTPGNAVPGTVAQPGTRVSGIGRPGDPGQATIIVGEFGLARTPADLPPDGRIPVDWDGPGRPPNAFQMGAGQSLIYHPVRIDDPLFGHVFQFSTIAVTPAGWLDIGQIVGPQGPAGPEGPIGPPGPQGPPIAGLQPQQVLIGDVGGGITQSPGLIYTVTNILGAYNPNTGPTATQAGLVLLHSNLNGSQTLAAGRATIGLVNNNVAQNGGTRQGRIALAQLRDQIEIRSGVNEATIDLLARQYESDTDGNGLLLFGGGRFYKAVGTGLVFRNAPGNPPMQIEDNDGSNRRIFPDQKLLRWQAGQNYAVDQGVLYDNRTFIVTQAITNAPATPDFTTITPVGTGQSDYWHGTPTLTNWVAGNWVHIATVPSYGVYRLVISDLHAGQDTSISFEITTGYNSASATLLAHSHQGTGTWSTLRLSQTGNGQPTRIELQLGAVSGTPDFKILVGGETRGITANQVQIQKPPPALADGATLGGTERARIPDLREAALATSGDFIVGNGRTAKFYHPTPTDQNDGKIGARLFAPGLNIVGAVTEAGDPARHIGLWGDVEIRQANTNLVMINDGTGITTFQGGRFYKVVGSGVVIRQSLGNQQPQIENNDGTNRRAIIDTINGDARYMRPVTSGWTNLSAGGTEWDLSRARAFNSFDGRFVGLDVSCAPRGAPIVGPAWRNRFVTGMPVQFRPWVRQWFPARSGVSPRTVYAEVNPDGEVHLFVPVGVQIDVGTQIELYCEYLRGG